MEMKNFKRVSLIALTAGMMAIGATGHAQEIEGGAGIKPVPVPASMKPVTQAMLNGASKDSTNWLHSNGDYAQTRFYPATQINQKNVKSLKPKFVFQTAVIESMETSPIVAWWDNSRARHIGYVPQDSSDVFRDAVYAKTQQPDLTDPVALYQGGGFVKAGPFGF